MGCPPSIKFKFKKKTLKQNTWFGSHMMTGDVILSCSSEFRTSILAYLGTNVHLVSNFLHPTSQRGTISFPSISTYMSLWRCFSFCTSGEFLGNVCLPLLV